MARRTFAQLATEVQTRMGLAGSSAGLTRCQGWVTSAYYFMATAHRHPELEDLESWTMGAGQTSEPFTDTTRIVHGIRLADSAEVPLRGLEERPIREIVSNFSTNQARPTVYAIHGRKVYFSAELDDIYFLQVFRSKFPTAPDYSGSATSELGEELDERLVEEAVALGRSALGIPESPDAGAQAMAMTDATVTGTKSGRSRPDPLTPREDPNLRGVR